MRKLITIQFLTLDGVCQSPGRNDEDNEDGFENGGWQLPYMGIFPQAMPDFEKFGALLIGRKTYDIFASYWPTTGKDVPRFGPFMNKIKKYVASNTLKKTDWENSSLLNGNVVEEVKKLKTESGKDIYMYGSSDLCQTLMRHNLIDEYVLMIFPLTIGKGKRLFREDSPKQNLELIESKIKDGILALTYKVKR